MTFGFFLTIALIAAGVWEFWLREHLLKSTKITPQELADPFFAEVMYNEAVIAHISDRQAEDMFWRRYQITPIDEAAKELMANDELWDKCVFYFRDPIQGVPTDSL